MAAKYCSRTHTSSVSVRACWQPPCPSLCASRSVRLDRHPDVDPGRTLKRPSTEILVNFMFEEINSFLYHPDQHDNFDELVCLPGLAAAAYERRSTRKSSSTTSTATNSTAPPVRGTSGPSRCGTRGTYRLFSLFRQQQPAWPGEDEGGDVEGRSCWRIYRSRTRPIWIRPSYSKPNLTDTSCVGS